MPSYFQITIAGNFAGKDMKLLFWEQCVNTLTVCCTFIEINCVCVRYVAFKYLSKITFTEITENHEKHE